MPPDKVLTIVIPAYNASLYIEDCLRSILPQLNREVELVIVDDGSIDNTFDLVNACAEEYSKNALVQILRQVNSGPGSARNTGIAAANGQYIAFLDSDDLVSPEYVRVLLEVIAEHEPEIIEFSFQRVDALRQVTRPLGPSNYGVRGLLDLSEIRLRIFSRGAWFSCTRVFKRDLLGHINFPDRVHYEDLMTIPFIYLAASQVYVLDQALLIYRENPTSITATHTNSQFNDVEKFFHSLDGSRDPALAILKIRVGRMLAFFSSEMKIERGRMRLILQAVSALRLAPAVESELLVADRIFYRVPRLYGLAERIRVPMKLALNRARGLAAANLGGR